MQLVSISLHHFFTSLKLTYETWHKTSLWSYLNFMFSALEQWWSYFQEVRWFSRHAVTAWIPSSSQISLKTLKCILSRQHKSVERASVIFHCGDFFLLLLPRFNICDALRHKRTQRESQVAFLLKQSEKEKISQPRQKQQRHKRTFWDRESSFVIRNLAHEANQRRSWMNTFFIVLICLPFEAWKLSKRDISIVQFQW